MGKLKTEIEKLLTTNRDRRAESLRKQWRSACIHAARNGRLSCLLPDTELEFDLASEWALREGFRVGGCEDGVIVFFERGE